MPSFSRWFRAEEQSISKAADRLYLAQSSLSQYVSRYEAELGVKLFRRTSGGVRTTAAGDLFLKNARQMLLQYHQVRQQLTDLDAPMEGQIHFGISTFRGSYLFPKAMHLFRQEAPTVDVVLHEHDSIYLHSGKSPRESWTWPWWPSGRTSGKTRGNF